MNCFEFADEWEKTEKYICVFIRTMVFCPDKHYNLLQRVASAMWKKIDVFDSFISSFKTWTVGIARLECLNYLHSSKSSKALFDDEILNMVTNSMCQEDCADPQYDNLNDCMLAIATEKIELFKIKYYEHLLTCDIALKMGISDAAVKEKLYRIRKELKSMIITRKNTEDH